MDEIAEHPLKTTSEPNKSRTSFANDFIHAPEPEYGPYLG